MNRLKYIVLLLMLIPSIYLYSQAPIANFSQNATTGCGMLVTTFHDLSTGAPTSWLWNFGDGFTSNIQHPTHAYTAPGVYTVSLTATNASGSNNKTINSLITVFAKPTVNFQATTDTIGCQPFHTAFSSQANGPAPINQYTWDYGDGNSSSLSVGDHIYTIPGLYTVTLTVRDANQCTGAKTRVNYIRVKPKPTAAFIASPVFACNPPLTVNFNNNSTGNGLTYDWIFGDGSIDTIQSSLSHEYTTAGSFTPTLIVHNDVGCSDTLTYTNLIDLSGFNAGFSALTTTGCSPFQTTFTSTGGSNATYQWSFGDGTNGTGESVTHQFAAAGDYDVTMVATNLNGCSDTTVLTGYIHVTPGPTINFSANDTVACNIPFLVNFTNLTPNVQSVVWSFGDGNTSTSLNPSHTYTQSGTFPVTLTVTDNLGCTNSFTKPNYINIDLPDADFNADVRKGCVPLTVNFTDESTIAPAATSWLWDFGDGQTATGQNPTHVYSDTGHYNVTLIVFNAEGCSDTLLMTDYIKTGVKPTAAFVGDSLFGCHPLKTQFTDLSTGYGNEWHWYFVNDGESTEQDPMHTFQDTLFVDVALVVSHNGCQDSLMKEDYVYVRFPKPQFTAVNPINCIAPHTVEFHNTSQGGTDFLWRFGDGGTSTDTSYHQYHTYTSPGTYSVELRVFNDTNMCADSTKQTFLIKISDLHPNFTINPPVICQYDSVCFSDNTTSYFGIKEYKWRFDDGVLGFGENICHQYIDSTGLRSPRLTVTDSNDCVVPITLTNGLTVNTLPSPRFSADQTHGCPPFTAQFSDLSFNQNPSTMVAWLWNFGDGGTSNLQNPTHIYADTGSYHVTLTVTDAHGCDSTYTIQNYIQLSYPIPHFTSDTIVCSGDTLCFYNQSQGASMTYLWDFGDGVTSTLPDVTHAFSVDTTSVLPVTLTATDQYGCAKSIVRNITISKPVSRFAALSQTSDCPPFNANFIDQSDLDVVYWQWNFGDTISANNNQSFVQNPQHIYSNSGSFDVTLEVVNSRGCKDTTTVPDYIFVDGPRGTFDFNPKVGCAPLTVTFTSNTENTAEFFWVFGDGGSATGNTVTYTFTDGGFYLPVLVLKDSLNTALGDTALCTVTLVSTDTIRVLDGLADFTVSDSLFCINELVSFTDISSGNGQINQWLWDFGDGNSSTLQNPTHGYATSGDFTVNFTVWVDSCQQTISHYVHVFPFPDVLINIFDTVGCSPFETDFQVVDSTVVPPGNAWLWDFGDGSPTVAQQNTDHQYLNSGAYNVGLTITFGSGCENTYHYPVNIEVYPSPNAEFTYDGNYVYPGVPINFTDQSTGDVFSWNWTFGDATSANTQNTSHSWSNSGYHRVTLVVTSSKGCQDSVSYQLVTTEGINIPNVFTPNNDGVNDEFYIETYGEFEIANMKIFNRWGELIWETSSPTVFWNGKNSNDEEYAEGTYFYIYNAKSMSGKEYQSHGSVTLLR